VNSKITHQPQALDFLQPWTHNNFGSERVRNIRRVIVISNIQNYHKLSTLALFPARMMEISSPRLNAWLKRRRDWKVEMNGNHDNTAIGTKISIPIPASYILANSRTDSQSPKLLTTFFQVIASCFSTTTNKNQTNVIKHQHHH
jgi:hypothetical protein